MEMAPLAPEHITVSSLVCPTYPANKPELLDVSSRSRLSASKIQKSQVIKLSISSSRAANHTWEGKSDSTNREETMVRGKVRMRRIDNPAYRRVTFCKRREGLLKKARELSVLCDAEVGVIMFSSQGKLHELATNGNMQSLVERYQGDVVGSQMQNRARQCQVAEPGFLLVREEIGQLQQGLRSTYGGGAGDMTLDKLQTLEKSLELWICQMRSTKMLMMQQEIQFLENKVKEQNELMNMCSAFVGSPYSTPPDTNGNCFFSI